MYTMHPHSGSQGPSGTTNPNNAHPFQPAAAGTPNSSGQRFSSRLTVATEGEGVVLAPSSSLGGVVVLGALSDTTVLAALGGEATSLAVLVDGVADPVDAGVTTDSLVRGVDKDDLVVLVDTVTVDLVRVQAALSVVTLKICPAQLLTHGGFHSDGQHAPRR